MSAIKSNGGKKPGSSGGGSGAIDLATALKNPKSLAIVIMCILIFVCGIFLLVKKNQTVDPATVVESETAQVAPTGTYSTRINEVIVVTPTPLPDETDVNYIVVDETASAEW